MDTTDHHSYFGAYKPTLWSDTMRDLVISLIISFVYLAVPSRKCMEDKHGLEVLQSEAILTSQLSWVNDSRLIIILYINAAYFVSHMEMYLELDSAYV